MKVIMTLKEKMCIENAQKYKSWDYIIPAQDSYLQAIRDVIELVNRPDATIGDLWNLLNEEVEVEFKDGSHQLYNKDKK